jgi:Xaa-Pro aminopeptidase
MNKRLKNLQTELKAAQLDGILIRNFEGNNHNIHYASGFSGTTAVLLVTQKKSFLITDARYWLRAEEEAPDCKLVKVERGKRITDFINQAIDLAGLNGKTKIGFEAGQISVEVNRVWTNEINAKLVPTLHFVERLRQYKDENELKLLRHACKITCKIFGEVAELVEPGMTENEVAFELDTRHRLYGAVNVSFPSIVASGPNSAIPHHATGNRKLQAGEPLIMDFGGLYPGGYCSDLTRTIFVPGKKPDKKMVEIYQITLEANKKAFKALKPGMLWKDYDKVARDYIAAKGYGQYFTHGLGHSVGLEVHDPFDYEHDTFEIGSVVTNEPGIYIDGLGGVRIEDDLVVTADGAERLTKAPYLKF